MLHGKTPLHRQRVSVCQQPSISQPLRVYTRALLVYKKDYEVILKIKSIYEVLEKETYGYVKIKKILKINNHFIVILITGYILFLLLTNTIFDIEVVHSNKEIRNLIEEELKQKGIKKYTLKKSFKKIEQIKEKILNEHPEEIERQEIETSGTK